MDKTPKESTQKVLNQSSISCEISRKTPLAYVTPFCFTGFAAFGGK